MTNEMLNLDFKYVHVYLASRSAEWNLLSADDKKSLDLTFADDGEFWFVR